MTTETRIAAAGILFLFAFVFGIWLSSSGKPLNTAIFTAHKLIALAAIIFSAVIIYQLFNGADPRTIQPGAVIATGLLVLITFASGAWLSIAKPTQVVVLTIHKVVPVLAAVSTAATIYLLAARD